MHLFGMKRHSNSAPIPSPPVRYEIEGRAFQPGETVGVAILLRNTEADRYGETRVLIDPAELPRGCEGVLLFGYDSGTMYYEDPR